MEENKETLISSLNERFNSQFFVTYIFYVFLLNWKAFGYMLNTNLILPNKLNDIEERPISKLDFIQNQFDFFSVFLIPIGLTILSILVLPIINRFVAEYRHMIRIQKENSFKNREFGDLLRTTEEYRDLEKELKNLHQEFKDAIETKKDALQQRDERVEALTRVRTELDSLRSDYNSYIARTEGDIKERQVTINELRSQIIRFDKDLLKVQKNKELIEDVISSLYSVHNANSVPGVQRAIIRGTINQLKQLNTEQE